MKNIGVIVDNEFNSDIRVRKEIEILKNNGHKIHVLCFAFDDKHYPNEDDINVVRISIKRSIKNLLFFLLNRFPFYDLLWKKHIKKFILNNQIEALHVHDLYMSKSAYQAVNSIKRDIPIILDLHENFPYAAQLYNWTKGFLRHTISNPKAWLKKERKYLSYSDKLILLSESFKQDLMNRYDFLKNENLIVFPNVIDLRKFEQFEIDPAIQKNDKITLMYFGGIAERRGIFETFQVFKEALKQNQNLELLLIGPVDKADKKRFTDEINASSVKDSITYIPWIPLSDLVSYMHISDIFLSPLQKNEQHESGVANKLYQYMFGAKPILVSNCKPQKELIENCNCGLSYSNNEEYLNCILTLANDENIRLEMGANGRKQLYERYDNSTYENILLNLYK
ncbi:glycosyltransferase family 4 protein [Tenacibaculum sp. 190524A05c]|uniref:Glycosyl transferase family 1 n=1 Tax=Tenacibaculum platacis TaxID=3137852 RepID=A0ABP1ETU5_9FLAO